MSFLFKVLGRRGLSNFERLMLGSTSKYVVENANCNVLVAKLDSAEKQKIEAEEEEKIEQFHSNLNRNISILAEEEERMRRIKEEKPGGTEEAHAQIAAKVANLFKDEQKRKQSQEQIVEASKLNVENFGQKSK